MEDGILRRKNVDRSFFDRYSRAAQIGWIGRVVAAVEVSRRGFVLNNQSSTSLDEIQQLLVICGHVLLRVVSANSQNNRAESAEVFSSQMFGRDQGDIHPDLFQDGRNIISSAHDVAELEIVGNLHIDDADALACGLIVVKAAQIFAGDKGVTFAVFFAVRFEDGADRGTARLQSGRNDLEWNLLLFSPVREVYRGFSGFRSPA